MYGVSARIIGGYLVIVLALTGFADAKEPAWRTGRVTTVRVLERSEGGAKVTPPVQDERGGISDRSYGASAYLELLSDKDVYRAQYAGPDIEALTQLRGHAIQFRVAGSTLYLNLRNGRPVELHILPSKRLPGEK
jgi:hypothetical protein